jgi:hypothetical protein
MAQGEKSMNAESKLAYQRLSVLELAQSLGNVAEACRQRGVSRTQFYEYKRRFQTHGIEGLKDLPPVHKSHPQTTSPEVVEKLWALSLANPTRECNWLHDRLLLEGIQVSAPTIQSILNKHDLGSRYERLLKLEMQALQQEIELTAEQVALIEKANPCFRERHVESSRPGELLSQDTFYVGNLKGIGKLYCTRWSTPTGATPSATCTPASSQRPRRWSYTTTCCPSTRSGI